MRKYYEEIDAKKYKHDDLCFIGKDRIAHYIRPVELPATGWVSLKDRKPTVEDANKVGVIWVRHEDGTEEPMQLHDAQQSPWHTHFHPIAKFQEDKPANFERFLRTKGYEKHDQITAEKAAELHAEYAALQKEGS